MKPKHVAMAPNGLAWFRLRSGRVASALLPVFVSASLFPSVAAAQAASRQDWRGTPGDVSTGEVAENEVRAAAEVPESSAERAAIDRRGLAGIAAGAQAAIAASLPGTNGPSPAGGPGTSHPVGTGEISAHAISLPSGAATMGGMGESFTAQLTTGVAAFNIPLALPEGRAGLSPSLSLVYSSSGGYGIAGVGWALAGSLAVARQSDRGLPRYDDRGSWHPGQDRFVFGGQELVPICSVVAGVCAGALPGEAMPPWSDGWQYFRARVEGAFFRFFWSPDHLTWRIQSKAGINFELGVPLDGTDYTGALERNPSNPGQIYRWQVVRQYDSHGAPDASPPAPANVIAYRYLQDGNLAYLSDIYYTPPASEPGTTDFGRYAHRVALSYQVRPDRSVSYRSGWLLEQRIRLARADVTSKPFSGAESSPRKLVRRFHLEYEPETHASLLSRLAVEGRCPDEIAEQANGQLPPSSCPRLPPVSLEYQRVAGDAATLKDSQGLEFERFSKGVREVDASPPHTLGSSGSGSGLIDVNSDGLPDLVVTSPVQFGGEHGVYFNRGEFGGKVRFAPVERMAISGVSGVDAGLLNLRSSNVGVLDLDGNGTADLVHMPMVKRYSVFTPENQGGVWRWQGRAVTTASGQNVKINFAQDARRTAIMDVDGDGLVDVVVASATEYQTYLALGRYPGGDGQFGHGGWSGPDTAELSNDPIATCTPWSAEPARIGDDDVRVGDVNGDGLPDLVRLRTGQALYWPGRGNGFWGTGEREACEAGSFGRGQHVQMGNAPRFGTAQPGTLQLGDVNGDGLADVIEIRADAVDIYLNDNGLGFTDRLALTEVPFRANNSNPVALTDINGSGSMDLLWATGHEYRYLDLTGGIRPYLLTKVHNGLGKTTELEYRSSAELMVGAAEAGQPWASVMPLSAPVVVSVTARDNLENVGRAGGRYVTEYSYRDPVFDGRQREFRGFRSAETKQLGDANSPTSIARSTHLVGECKPADSGLDVCAPSERWRDNWREPLKGLPVLSETFDEGGVYLGTEHRQYELKQLYAGLDGRRVSVARQIGQRVYSYDTAAFDAAGSTVSLPEVTVHLDGIQQSESRSVVRRAGQGTARLESTSAHDDFGNVTSSTSFGCVEGCAAADEAITTHATTERVPGDTSGWLFRTTGGSVTGSVHTAPRHQVRHEYDGRGDLKRSFATLGGTLPLDRFHETNAAVAPAPPGASAGVAQPVEIETGSFEHDDFGNVLATRAPGSRCRSVAYALDYADLPISETIFGGATGGNGCGERSFATEATYDRGLSLVLTTTNITGQPARFDHDGFGRLLAETYADPHSPGQLASLPSATYEYHFPEDWTLTPYSLLVVRSQDGLSPNTAEYHESFQYADGLGRTIIALAEADPSAGDGGAFVAGGSTDYTAKGEPLRAYENRFWSGNPFQYPLAEATALRYTSQLYDAFGRAILSYGFDGEVKLATEYHALSVDGWDAADLAAGPHAGSFGTVRSDGHGRQVEAIERVRVDTVLEERRMLSEYLPTGELRRVTQRRAGSPDVVRWLKYDSLGRLVLNAEPNTSVGFNPDPGTDPTTIKAWRYAYDDAGELVGTSDARGCGVNYHHDTAGRLVAEDYSPCKSEHAAYSAPNFTAGTGIEVLYRHDVPDPDTAGIEDAAGRTLDIATPLLWGRTVSVSDLGQKSVLGYDALGRPTGTARRMVKPGAPSIALADRYAPRWYIQQSTLDGASRPLETSTGASTSALTGADGRSVVQSTYSARGLVKTTSSSYGTLLQSRTVDANGLPRTLIFGDAAGTARTYSYDQNDRLDSVQTYRATAALWSNPELSTPSTGEPTQQLLLEDYDFTYDAANNVTDIRDYRLPEEWPAAAKPVTRHFEYDDLYRLTRATYEYTGGTDTWTSPFAAENAQLASVEGEPKPSPHVNFPARVLEQRYEYDHLGNTKNTSDDADGFFDRSLGTIQNGAPGAGPHRLTSATNRQQAPTSPRKGDLDVAYDAAGNITALIVRRDGACLPAGASCYQRYHYQWDELGRLDRARRWDLTASPPDERATHGALTDPPPARTADVELRYTYTAGGGRALKTAIDPASVERHTVYIFGSLELRKSAYEGGDYELTASTENILLGGGVSARVIYAEEDLPTLQSGGRHLFLLLSDYLGSNTFIIDHETGELVEHTTYQAYGSTESNYRPGRWGNHREPVKFTGKEEDIEVGLVYFGARYLSVGLGRWMSPDLVTLHELEGDPNPYAYVHGRPLVAVDPDGNFAFLAMLAVAVVVSATANAATQASNVGWGNINWGGVAVAAVAGGAGAAVGGPVGSWVGGALASTLGATASGVIGAAVGSAAGGVVSYGTGVGANNALAGLGVPGMQRQSLTSGGVGRAAAYGAVGGAASFGVGGALANSGIGKKLTASLTKALGDKAGKAVAGGTFGAVGGLASGAAVAGASGGKMSASDMLIAAGSAGVAAGTAGAVMNSRRTDPTRGRLSGSENQHAPGAGRPKYVPAGPDGKRLPLPHGPSGEVAPSSNDPHTQIGWQDGRRGSYVQTREFGSNGKPVKQVDWTDHGRPAQHTDPHIHDYVPNPTGGTPKHGPARPPYMDEL